MLVTFQKRSAASDNYGIILKLEKLYHITKKMSISLLTSTFIDDIIILTIKIISFN